MHQTERILEQGKALVRAIEALETIKPSGPLQGGPLNREQTLALLKKGS